MDENKNKSNSTLKKDEKIREHDMTFIEYIKMKSKDKLTIDGEVGIKTRELAQRVGINYEMFRKILNKTKPNQPRDCIIAICAALFLSEYETNDSNLFIFEDKDLKQSEVSSAFADSELLSRITKDKSKHSQLLITNDKNLSVDAYKLNKLYSCKGKKIMVCFIDNLGQLNKGKTGFETNLNTLVIEQKTPEEQVEEQNNNQEESKIFQKIIWGGCLLSVGFVIGKISNKLT